MLEKVKYSLQNFSNILINQLSINFLGYRRLYNNNKVLVIATNNILEEFYHKSNMVMTASLLRKIYETSVENYQVHYWADKINGPLCQKLYDSNLWHGISIYKKSKDYTEIFSFCTTRENREMINFYINHLSVFEKIILYIKANLKDLTSAVQNFILNTEEILKYENKIDQEKNKKEIESFLQEIQVKKYFIGRDIYITQKQLEILRYLYKGKSTKEIAWTLNTSSRTIETHISNIKNTTSCGSKSSLIELALKKHLL